MTLRYLEVFCMVCRENSMTRAAEKLHMVQPAVSRTVAALENYYRVKLFERIDRKLHLTPEGNRLWSDAEQVLADFEKLEANLADRRESPRLRVGCSIGIGSLFMRRYLDEFRKVCPHVRVSVSENHSQAVKEKLLANELDFAIVEGFVTEENLIGEGFFDDELIPVCAPNHPLAGKECVTMKDLAAEDLFLPEPGTGTRDLLTGAAAAAGCLLDPVWSGLNYPAMLDMAREGLGVTILSRYRVAADIEKGALIALPNHLSLTRRFSIVYHRNKYLSDAARTFMAICKQTGFAD